MKKNGLSSINVEQALETMYEATSFDMTGEVFAAYCIIKEFIQVVKEGIEEEDVGVLLRKKE